MLTPKKRMFAREYLKDLNATQAAIRAGYSKRTAKSQGQRLLTDVDVAALIAKHMDKRKKKTEIDANWVLKRLAEEADADLADLYDENMQIKPVDQWPEVWRRGLVQGVEVTSAGDDAIVTKVRLSDRVKRLELIGKHIDVSAFAERRIVTGADGGPVQYVIQPVKTKDEVED